MSTEILLKCPHCGGKMFSWLNKNRVSGTIRQSKHGSRYGYSDEIGEVVDNDLHSHGALCIECSREIPLEDLEHVEDNDA